MTPTGPTPTDHEWGIILVAFMAILIGAYYVLQIVAHFRRQPPIEAEYATKAELKEAARATQEDLEALRIEVNAALNARMAGMSDKIELVRKEQREDRDKLGQQMSQEIGGVQRRINVVLSGLAKVAGVLSAKTGQPIDISTEGT